MSTRRQAAQPRYTQEEVLERMSEPEMFKGWIRMHNRGSMWTGRLVYCEGGNFGFTSAGHFVTRDQIAIGYRGHYTCKACAERLYGEKERAARAKLEEADGVQGS